MTIASRMFVTLVVLFLVYACAAPGVAGWQAQPPSQQEEFIPIDQLPPQDELAAAPLLIGAYAFVLVMLFGYIVTVSRRLSAIQHEVNRLDADLKRGSRA